MAPARSRLPRPDVGPRPPRTEISSTARLAPLAVGAFALVLVVVGGFAWARLSASWQAVVSVEPIVVQAATATVLPETPPPRELTPYVGLGTWIDAFDYAPAYGIEPDIEAMVSEMSEYGIQTIFVQSGRLDDRSPETLEDRWVLAELLLRAHDQDMAVVAWFLPKWTEPDEDLRHLVAASTFSVLGQRFDGVAVDIEWNQDGLEPDARSQALVTLSERLATVAPDEPLGAIVMPNVLLDVINPDFWPDFPWIEISPYYDVWLPMSYWSFRSNESGYGGGYAYNAESTELLREQLGDPTALVHGIGGIGSSVADDRLAGTEPIASIDDVELFVQSLVDTDSVGGSIYDWNTTDQPSRELLRQLFSTGPAAGLGAGS